MIIYEVVDGKKYVLANPKESRNVSDGYHTFDELYEHRCLLYIALCLQLKDKIQVGWKNHYDGWFLLFAELPSGQISYHIPVKYLELVEKGGVDEITDYEWDGHASQDVIDRLIEFIK